MRWRQKRRNGSGFLLNGSVWNPQGSGLGLALLQCWRASSVEEAAKLLVITPLTTNDLFLGFYLALMFSIKTVVTLYKMSGTVYEFRRKSNIQEDHGVG